MTYAPHPGRGVAMLACACGKVLDAADMCWRRHERQKGAAVLVERITCARCADVGVPLTRSTGHVIRDDEDGGIVVWSKGRAS